MTLRKNYRESITNSLTALFEEFERIILIEFTHNSHRIQAANEIEVF